MNTLQTKVNILLCGSAHVGKSSLINAICNQKMVESSVNLDTSTHHLIKCQMEYTKDDHLYQINFWDSPGIESWDENVVRNHMKKLIMTTNPICMIYCASPGSFAKLQHVEWLVSECAIQKIFCALVCTNMWGGRTRQLVLGEFRKILQKIHQDVQPSEENKIIYFGRFGLCTMVNSETYIDNDAGLRKEPSGVNELISGIAKSLEEEHRCTWLRVVAGNASFWSQMACERSVMSHVSIEKETPTINARIDEKSSFGFMQDFGSSRDDSDTSDNRTPSSSSNSETDKSSARAIENNNNSSSSDPPSHEIVSTEEPPSANATIIGEDSRSYSDTTDSSRAHFGFDKCSDAYDVFS